MNKEKRQKIIIILLPIFGWLIACVAGPYINSLLITRPYEVNLTEQIMWTAMLYLVVWIPVGIIGYRMFKKRGFRSALIFLLAALAVSILMVQGCMGM